MDCRFVPFSSSSHGLCAVVPSLSLMLCCCVGLSSLLDSSLEIPAAVSSLHPGPGTTNVPNCWGTLNSLHVTERSSFIDLYSFTILVIYNLCLCVPPYWQKSSPISTNQMSKLFFVFMWLHHFPKLQISNPTGVLVSSDIRHFQNLAFYDV